VILLLFSLRQRLAKLYYWYFYPHPAEPLVRAALSTGNVLDAKAFANALSELPPGNPILRAVRMEQADRLFQEMKNFSLALARQHEAKLRAEESQNKIREKEEYQRTAFEGVHEAVELAAVALERAKAIYRASQEIGAI
jgi:hypothetical protein